MHELHGSGGREGQRRRGRGRVDEAARPVDQQVDHAARGRDVAAADAECLAERSHLQWHALLQAELRNPAAPARAEHADGMGLVHEQQRVMRLAQIHDFAQRGGIAVHAEDAFGDDEDSRARKSLACRFQQERQPVEVVVREHSQRCAAEPCGVDQRSVTEFVEDDGVVLSAERREDAHGRGVTAREGERGLRALESCERLLEPFVHGEIAAHET